MENLTNKLIGNLAAVAYTNFGRDSRVQKEAHAAKEFGFKLDIYTLRNSNLANFRDFNFVKIGLEQYRGNSQLNYILSYIKFFILCFIKLTLNHFSKRYKVIHFHNMPNFLVFAGLIPKFFGAKLILDIHDLMPELFSVKFNIPKDHPLIKLLYFEERISAKFADEIIATNMFHIERFKKNGLGHRRFTEIINVADERIFYPPQHTKSNSELVIAYPSTLSKRLGIDCLIEAIEILHKKEVSLKLNIYGDGEYRNEISRIIKTKGLDNIISLSETFISLEKLSSELDNADIGIIPLPSDRSNDIAMPVKIYEFFAKKICVIASDLPLLRSCFNDFVIFFEAGNSLDLAYKIEYLNNNKSLISEYAEKGYKKFMNRTWGYYKSKYWEIINYCTNTVN